MGLDPLLQSLLTSIVQSIVSEPDQVLITMVEIEGVETYEITVAEFDLGSVIGRKNNTAMAVRTVVGAVAAKLDRRISLEFLQSAAER